MREIASPRLWMATSALLLVLAACGDHKSKTGPVANSKVAPVDGSGAPPLPDDPAMVAKEGGPTLGAIQMTVSIYERPDHRSKKVGYLRVGTIVPRAEKAAAFDSCQGGFFNILPSGYVCLDDGASNDVGHPLLRAGLKQANHKRPMPYAYAFV